MTETKGQTAAAELERAEQEAREVLEWIKDGDPKAGPEDLEAAERRVRFARARLEGQERREAEEAEEERLRSLADVAELTQDRVKASGVQNARKAAEKALETYVAACMAHNEAVDEAAGVFLSQRDLPRGYAVDMGRDGHSIVLGSGSIRRVRPMVEVRDMGLEVLGRYLRGGYISLGDDAY